MTTLLNDLADALGGEREITLGETDRGLCAGALRILEAVLRGDVAAARERLAGLVREVEGARAD